MFQGIDIALDQFVSGHQTLCHSHHLVRKHLVSPELVLDPVALLFVSEGSHQVVVVRVVVQTVERGQVLVPFHQHALLSECIVVKRSVHLRHAVFLRPFLSSTEKQPRHLDVIYGIEPSETCPFLSVTLVVPRIYHSADTADDLISVCHHPHLPGTICE